MRRREQRKVKKKETAVTKGEREGEGADRPLTLRGDFRQRGANGTGYMGYLLPRRSERAQFTCHTAHKHTYVHTLTIASVDAEVHPIRHSCSVLATGKSNAGLLWQW